MGKYIFLLLKLGLDRSNFLNFQIDLIIVFQLFPL